jgi:hypothetical protein
LVNREEELAVWSEIKVADVPAMCEGESVGSILGQIEDRDSIAHWREDGVAIGSEDEVAPSVDCSEKVGELADGQ